VSLSTEEVLNEEPKVEASGPNSLPDDAFQSIEVDGDEIRIDNFCFHSSELADYLRPIPAEQWPYEVTKAIELGVFCLVRATASRDAEFVKHQAERVINSVESRVGALPKQLRDELMAKIGTGDGQVLKPVNDLIDRVTKALGDRVTEVKELFGENLDPEKESSSLGHTLKAVAGMVDPQRKDSIQSTVESAIKGISGGDGALAKTVKEVVTEVLKPLKEEFDLLAKEFRGQEAAEEALQQTTLKGGPYELVVVDLLRPWTQAVGAGLNHTGTDNKPGDVVLTFNDSSFGSGEFRIVIEARNRDSAKGRKAIAEDLDKKMAERSANAAIYLSRTEAGLAREIGDWSEGESELGPWVATTQDHLITAVRFLVAMQRLRSLKSEAPTFDAAMLENQIERIRTALKRVQSINRKVTNARDSVDDISTEANALRDEIKDALINIEDGIRKAETSVD